MQHAKALIVKDAVKSLSRMKYITSLTLVGSHASLNKKAEYITDLDLLIIVSKITPNRYQDISGALRKIAKKHSSNDSHVFVETRIGPIKFRPRKKTNIMIHQLLYDEPNMKAHAIRSPLAPYDWQRFPPLFGKPFAKIANIKKIDREMVLTKRHGIDSYQATIRESGVKCYRFQRQGNKMKLQQISVKYSPMEKAAFLYNILNQTMNNIVKVRKQRNVRLTHEQILSEFRKKLPKYALLYAKLYAVKQALRNNRKTKVNLPLLSRSTLDCLDAMRFLLGRNLVPKV